MTDFLQDEAELSRQGLKEASLVGARVTAISRVAIEAFVFLTALVVARLVPPPQVGHAAIAIVLPVLATILSFEGFGSVLVQKRQLELEHIKTAFTLALGTTTALTVLVLAIAKPVGGALFGHAVAHLLILAAPVFLAAGVGTVSRAKLQRELEFTRMSIIDFGSSIIGATTTLVLAIIGLDAEAMVLGTVALCFSEAAFMLVSAPPPRPGFSRRHAREIVAYGSFASLGGISYAVRRNVDYFLLGARLSPTQVGLYYRAFSLGGEYQSKLSGIFVRILFPLYARAGGEANFAVLRRRSVTLNATLLIPALAALIALAPEAVRVLFGSNWDGSATPARILAVAGMALTLLAGTEAALLAAGLPRRMLAFNGTFLVVDAVALLISIPHGLIPVCIAVTVVHVGMVFCVYGVIGRKIGMSLSTLWSDCGAGFGLSLAVLASCWGVAAPLRAAGWASGFVLLVAVPCGAIVYLIVLRRGFPSAWRDLRSLIAR